MNKRILIKVLIMTIILAVYQIGEVQAISKLDFGIMGESTLTNVQSKKRTYIERYNEAMSKMETKVLKASGEEGRAIYSVMKKQMKDSGYKPFSNVKKQIQSGNLDFNDMISAFKESGKEMLALATSEQALKDYNDMKIKMNEDKKRNMKNRLVVLETELQRGGHSEEELESIAQEMASLEKQLLEIEQNEAKRDEKREELEAEVNEVSESIGRLTKLQNNVNDEMLSKLNEMTENLKKKEEKENAENVKRYDDTAKNMFLGKRETENAKSVARIKHIRDKEYYLAVHELFRTTMVSTSQGEKISDKSATFLENTGEVDGLYGGMAMKLGIDIQRTKLAAQYANMLIAELRKNTTQEIASWNNMYRLRDYKKDFTKFNLDDYKLKSGFSRLAKEQYGKAKEKAMKEAKKKVGGLAKDKLDKFNNKHSMGSWSGL